MTHAWITVPYWWHATLLELLWLVGGLAATWLTSLNLSDAWKDRNVLADAQDDPAMHSRHFAMIKLAVDSRVSAQLLRLITSLLIAGVGLFAVEQPNPLGGKTTLTGFAVTVCLDGIAVLTALKSAHDRWQRSRMYELATGRTASLAAQMRALNKPTK